MEALTLPSAIATAVAGESPVTTAVSLASATTPAVQLQSPISTALTLASAIDLEDTES